MEKCVFPVAGYGTRFLPFTKTTPKELLPILNKPLIHYAVEEALDADIKDLILVDNQYKKTINDYFKPNQFLENVLHASSKESELSNLNELISKCNFSSIEQKEMLGLGHAILMAESNIGSKEAFSVILPDDFCINSSESVLKQMKTLHNFFPDFAIVAVEEVPSERLGSYGVVDIEPIIFNEKGFEKRVFRVKDMIEKPALNQAPSNLAIIGRYILPPGIFDVIRLVKPDKTKEIQITNALRILANQGKVIAFKFRGTRYDCGNIAGFVRATLDMAKKEKII